MSDPAPLDPAAASPVAGATFDAYADDYDAALDRGLRVSGENKDYFASRRIAWLAEVLRTRGEAPRRVLDYGCGVGDAAPHLARSFAPDSLVGVDVSARSIALAQRRHPAHRFGLVSATPPEGDRDLVYCNGIFHHIPVAERPAALAYVRDWLRPGGWFALWENNPWNPGTRYVMSRIPFDRDAILVYPHQARALLRAAGFTVARTDYLFFFPRALSALRALEPAMSSLPLGAQYLVLGRR